MISVIVIPVQDSWQVAIDSAVLEGAFTNPHLNIAIIVKFNLARLNYSFCDLRNISHIVKFCMLKASQHVCNN